VIYEDFATIKKFFTEEIPTTENDEASIGLLLAGIGSNLQPTISAKIVLSQAEVEQRSHAKHSLKCNNCKLKHPGKKTPAWHCYCYDLVPHSLFTDATCINWKHE
jgi:hypothetical protein